MIKINEVLNEGKKILKQNNIDTSEARLLLAFVLDIDVAMLVTKTYCDNVSKEKFIKCIQKRCEGIPFAYITEKQEFMKLSFKITQDVLIPRPDTEILVDTVIKIVKRNQEKKCNILDMCSGSGCIGISLNKYLDNVKITGVDISKNALEIARYNNIVNNTNVEFIYSDLFENINDMVFDIIVSNPPYIPTQDIKDLQKEVLNEPVIALDGGEDGLDIYRRIVLGAKNHLLDGGYLVFEIGYDQAKDVSNILEVEGYENIKVIKDLSNNDRVIICRFRKK